MNRKKLISILLSVCMLLALSAPVTAVGEEGSSSEEAFIEEGSQSTLLSDASLTEEENEELPAEAENVGEAPCEEAAGDSAVDVDESENAPVIIENPQDTTVTEGEEAIFTVAADGENLTYQWQEKEPTEEQDLTEEEKEALWKDCTLEGAQTGELKLTAEADRNGWQYRCIVTSGTASQTSEVATLTVESAASDTQEPADTTAEEGSEDETPSDAPAAEEAITEEPAVEDGNQNETPSETPATEEGNDGQPAESENSGEEISEENIQNNTGAVVVEENSAPTITKQPSSTRVTVGEKAYFTVTASGSNLKYQWQYQTASSTTWRNITSMTGAQTNKLTVEGKTSYNLLKFRCVVSSGTQSVATKAATLGVLYITKQPVSTTVTAGENATFTVASSSSSPTYQWQYQTASSTTWRDVTSMTGAQTDTLTVEGKTSYNGLKFRCVVTAGKKSVTSEAATLTVQPALSITKHPSSTTATEGANAYFTVTASGSNLSYQWQYRTSATAAWRNTTTLTGAQTRRLTVRATTARNGLQFRCIVKSGTKSVTSDAATLTVLYIKKHPASVTVAEGENATFTVTANGSNLSYQWQVNKGEGWSNLTAGGKSKSLTLKGTAERNGLQFRCVVTCGTKTVTSKAATLTVQSNGIVAGDFTFELIEGSTTDVRLIRYTGSEASVRIPDRLEQGQYIVKEIGAEAFMNKTMIVSVSMPNAIEKIGERAFKNCTSLKNMTCYDS